MGRRQWARLDRVQRVGDVAVTVDDVDDLVTEVRARIASTIASAASSRFSDTGLPGPERR